MKPHPDGWRRSRFGDVFGCSALIQANQRLREARAVGTPVTLCVRRGLVG